MPLRDICKNSNGNNNAKSFKFQMQMSGNICSVFVDCNSHFFGMFACITTLAVTGKTKNVLYRLSPLMAHMFFNTTLVQVAQRRVPNVLENKQKSNNNMK